MNMLKHEEEFIFPTLSAKNKTKKSERARGEEKVREKDRTPINCIKNHRVRQIRDGG